jgi:hypothetical protein
MMDENRELVVEKSAIFYDFCSEQMAVIIASTTFYP